MMDQFDIWFETTRRKYLGYNHNHNLRWGQYLVNSFISDGLCDSNSISIPIEIDCFYSDDKIGAFIVWARRTGKLNGQ
jgi:hypothetical protein